MRVKTGLRGQKKRPLPRQKARDAMRPKVPVILWQTKYAVKIPKKGASRAPAQNWAVPGSHSSEGWVRLPAGLVRPPPVFLENAWPQNKRGKRKQGKRSTGKPLPPSVPRKGPRNKHQENPKNARGPEWHPEKRQEAGRTAKTGKQTRRDTKKKRNQQTSACEGVSCYYLSFISSKKTKGRGNKPENVDI